MKKIIIILSACIFMTSLAGCGTTNGGVEMSKETEEALESAYIYTLPLVLINATMEKATNTVQASQVAAPINQLFHVKKLATSQSKSVVTPNVDTVYSQAFLDLSKEEAIILKKPESDRYYAIQVINAYSDTIDTLGTGSDGQGESTYLFTREDYKGEVPQNVKHVKINTDLSWLIIRIVCNGEDDYPNIYKFQEATQLMPLRYYLSGETYIPENGSCDEKNNFVPVEHVTQLSAKEYFDLANKLMINNPPQKQDSEIVKNIEKVNVGPGKTFDAESLGIDNDVWKKITSQANQKAAKETSKFYVQNGVWSYFGDPIGNFGTEYDYRGVVALKGLGANTIETAIYAKTNQDSEQKTLNGENKYIIHFEPNQLPPVEENGFWSITVYGQDDFLVENVDNKYAITDRSNFIKNTDGSVDLYLAKQCPENVEKANWLPIADGGFHLFLRTYLPDKAIKNGDWNAPTIKIWN